MKTIKYILLTLITLVSFQGATAAISGHWINHSTFDNSVTDLIATPTRVYFMGYDQVPQPAVDIKKTSPKSLFYYDIEGDELIAANRVADLTDTAIDKIAYNAKRGYLLIVYDNYDIDLLFDDGSVRNVPALKHADIPGSKKVNGVSFNPDDNEAWIATDFGYIIIDDDRFEVKDSRNYGARMLQAAGTGDMVVLVSEIATYYGKISEPRAKLADYTRYSEYIGTEGVYPLSSTRLITHDRDASKFNYMRIIDLSGGTMSQIGAFMKFWGPYNINPSKNKGITVMFGSGFLEYLPENDTYIRTVRPELDKDEMPCVTYDTKELFIAQPRKGLRSMTIDGTVTRQSMLPNAPNAFWSRGMAYHPTYGTLVNSHGVEQLFNCSGANSISEPILLSADQDGLWTPKSPAYTYPEAVNVGYNPLGLLIDPADSKYVWMGSNFSGITRLNLEDPRDLLHYSFPGDATASLPGYVETNETQPEWKRICQFTAPKLDAQNNMWCHFQNMSLTNSIELRYMTDADRRASRDASTARPWKKLFVEGLKSNMNVLFTPMASSANKNLLVFINAEYILIYDTNGTLEDTSDDRKALISGTIFDQDGGKVEIYQPNFGYEDPNTGFYWFGTASGIFYIQPQSILQGARNVNRVKVARNDGTSLADYLLNGVGVASIMVDPQGRKWFGTQGAGIVVTSGDGKTVYDEFTTANSGIPSDYVYSTCYNPSTRSVMVGTNKGIAEFTLGNSSEGSDAGDEIRAYPNPVAPDYYGWVTIDGLEDDTFVKVVDSAGNLVKELGRAETGSIQWDINNLYNKRVNTGVYYILSSPATGSGKSKVTKVLVMN